MRYIRGVDPKNICSKSIIAFWSLVAITGAQTWVGNHDESKVKSYSLPDPLTLQSGKKVRNAGEWKTQRRPEILRLFEENVYGKTPPALPKPRFEVVSTDNQALGGKAVRKQIIMSFPGRDTAPRISILLYVPAARKGPVPVFLGLNFTGNHTVDTDPGISIAEVWGRNRIRTKDTDTGRGSAAGRWQIERVLGRGYGVATAYYGDIEPDFDGGIEHGVRRVLGGDVSKERGREDWGAIGVWAWGLSRMADYLVSDKDIDPKRIAVTGHSRLGKTALWAGAQDERFAIVISNDSGEGGAALSRRNFGEDVWRINSSFPHWFSKAYREYSNREADLPVDQHMLLALAAPRPLYVASAAEDLHADPRGEFLSAVHAGPVYELLGKQGLGTDKMAPVDTPITKTIGYHVRTGKHDVTAYDWDRFCDFTDSQWKRAHL